LTISGASIRDGDTYRDARWHRDRVNRIAFSQGVQQCEPVGGVGQ
jgi:hypothetical protein